MRVAFLGTSNFALERNSVLMAFLEASFCVVESYGLSCWGAKKGRREKTMMHTHTQRHGGPLLSVHTIGEREAR
jgi:hypothetical protein